MKILRLRFQNLNSLSGTWDIRFTNPAYTENNIFAITGPTGAGKSTLLDGICLALYGTTPRLGKITKTSNEIMSRHTGICFSEVEFSTTKGIFRCHWSQHRSRNKAKGDLQQPKHEIADASSNIILESRIRNVASKVEEVTGMDFDRFTRSTLLAQGGFAAFLQASANERAPILEQITGTTIYSQLSMKVHELQSVEQQKLNELEQSLTHINLLAPEVEKELKSSLVETKKEGARGKTELGELQAQHVWLETIKRLTSEKNTYLQKLDLLNEETEERSEELKQLQPALAAKSIEPLYQELNILLEKEKDAAKEQSTLEKKFDDLSKKHTICQSRTEDAGKTLFKTKHSRETGLLLIRDVQALDHTILTTKKSLQGQNEELALKQTLQSKEKTLIDTLKQDLLQKQKDLTLLESFFTQHTCDELLTEELEAVRIQVSILGNLHDQNNAISTAGKKVKQTLQKSRKTVKKLNQTREKLQEEVLASRTHFDHLQEIINQILRGRNPSNLQQTLFRTRSRHNNLKNLLQLVSQRDGQIRKLGALHKEITDIKEQRIKTEEKYTICDKDNRAKQKEIEFLEKNVRLLIRIQTLEEDRKQLHDDTPCPLCGSTHHPYSHDNIPEISKEESLLQSAKKELAEIGEELARYARNSSIDEERFRNCSEQEKETEEQINTTEKEAHQLLSKLELPQLINIDPDHLENEYLELEKKQKQLENDWELFDKRNDELNIAGVNKEKLLTAEQQLERTILEATHHSASIEQEEQNLVREVGKNSEELLCIKNELLQKTEKYGIGSISEEQLPFIIKELEQRAKNWRENKEISDRMAPQITNLNSELDYKNILYKNLSTQISDHVKNCNQTQDEAEKTIKERTDLFGTKDPLQESQRLEQKVKDARVEYDKTLQEDTEIEKEITASHTLLNRLLNEDSTRKVSIRKQEDLFNQSIVDSDLASSQEFLSARIAPPQLAILQDLQNKLQRKKTELQALYKDKKIALQLEKARQLSEKSIKELNEQIDTLEKQQEVIREKNFTAKEQLKTNTSYKTKSKKQISAIVSQKVVVGRWNRLHMLIGSADGKKFRNFAQGLTFELMVHHANIHLQKMNNRYILIRDLEHPLDLNVIDTYQADEIRSTKNLSGGESFLVSLALALGLSRMASQNVRVDSLFLDEGFGTLDEDALESALETLAGLRDENKLIGIISHVAALKERIPLQIEIIPGSNGNSSIKGAGVAMEVQ